MFIPATPNASEPTGAESKIGTFSDALIAEAKKTVPAAFTASETFDVGVDLGSPVSRDYLDRRPFKFDEKIGNVKVEWK